MACSQRNWLSGSENYIQRNWRLLKFSPWKFTSVKLQVYCSPSPSTQLLAAADRPLGSGFGLKAKLSLMQTPQVLEMRRLEPPSCCLFSLLCNPHGLTKLDYCNGELRLNSVFAAMISCLYAECVHCESAQRSISEAEFKHY